MLLYLCFFFFFSSRRRHTRSLRDWSSDVCSSDLLIVQAFWRSTVGIRVPSVDMSDEYWLTAQAIGALLTPMALMALVLGLWGIAAELNWTTTFVILTGPFSRWEIWLCVAALLKS